MSAKLFVSCALGFQDELAREISEVWPFLMDLDGRNHSVALPRLDIVKGGVEFEAPLHLGMQLNLFLKIANRVLWRLDEQEIREFYHFESFVKKTVRAPRLKDMVFSEIQVAATTSKLGQEKRLEEAAWKVTKRGQGPSLYIRFESDVCSISLDLSGEHLHLRGNKEQGSVAPLRATLAAYCLRIMRGEGTLEELRDVTWLDPFCGSGTFLLEAADLFLPNLHRRYAFQDFALCPPILKNTVSLERFIRKDWKPRSLIGIEKDEVTAKHAIENVGERAKIFVMDSLRDSVERILEQSTGKLWIVANPPYGMRAKREGDQSQDWTAEALIEKLSARFNPEKIGLVLPMQGEGRLSGEVLRSQPFTNGGISVRWFQKG